MLQLFSGGFVHVERSNGFTPLRWIKRPTDPHNNQGKPAEHLNCLSKTPKKKALKKDIHSSIHPPNLTSTSPAASKGYHNQTPQTTTHPHPPHSASTNRLANRPKTGTSKRSSISTTLHQHNSSLNLETRPPTYHHDKPESSRSQ